MWGEGLKQLFYSQNRILGLAEIMQLRHANRKGGARERERGCGALHNSISCFVSIATKSLNHVSIYRLIWVSHLF